MPQRVAIYIRVSTQEQAQEGYSIEIQSERLTSYCKAKDWAIYDVYTDPGFSGSNTQRPALQKLFADIDAGRIDCVLVYKLDRLSRSQKDTLYMIEDVFLAHNVDFVSMQENFDTSSSFGRAMIGILSVFAQLEREQIKERMAMGRIGRAKAGFFHGGGYRPFGYDYEDSQLTINPAEAIIVRDVYAMFLAGTPMTRIEEIVHEKYGRHTHHTMIRSILSTPIYIGLVSWAGKTYTGQHEPIIDKETYQRAQLLLNDRARIAASKPKPFRATHLLSGLLVCGNCGALYFARKNYLGHGSKKRPRSYYQCYSRAKSSKERTIDPNCKNPTYPVDTLDTQVLDELERLVNDNTYFQSIVAKSKKKKDNRLEDDRLGIMQRIDELDQQISRVIDLYQLGSIGIDAIGQRTQKLQEEKAALQRTLDTIKPDQDDRLSVDEARSILSESSSVMTSEDMEAKRVMMQSLIKRIIVKPTKGDLEIVWNF